MKTELKGQGYSRKDVTILGVEIDSTPKSELLKKIEARIAKKTRFYIVTPNPEIVVEAQSDPELMRALNAADFSIPDGSGLRLADSSLPVVKGRDLMLDLLSLAASKGLKVYLLGSRPQVNKATLTKISNDFPELVIKGNHGPKLNNNAEPVSEVDSSLQSDVVEEINSFKPDLLFVAFGAPKQEKWVRRYIDEINAICVMTVGGSFDYYSGFVRPVPKFMEVIGLEWLWRFIQEPKRFRRIFNALIVFPIKVALSDY